MRRIDHRLGLVFLTGAFIASLVAACVAAATPSAAPSRIHKPGGEFVATGSMTMGRDSHTATLLPDGRVLIAGGSSYDEARSAELYDPTTGEFRPTGSKVAASVIATATLLLDGRVLFVGGLEIGEGSHWDAYDSSNRTVSAAAELYDPKTGRFTRTGSLAHARYYHTATRLLDGRVLIAGGELGDFAGPPSATDTAEIYDPATGEFTPTGSMTTPRWCHSATLLKDGRVLMAASWSDPSAELYDPATGRFSPTGAMQDATRIHMATLLRDGRVLIAGAGDPGIWSSLAEIYDPATGKFSPTGSMTDRCNLIGPIGLHSSPPLLADGRVMVPVMYGFPGAQVNTGVEFYDPATGTFTKGPPLSRSRSGFTETLLPDGRVLFTGNQHPVYPKDVAPPTDSASLTAAIEADRASAEIYVP